jgi:hypothetical protein
MSPGAKRWSTLSNLCLVAMIVLVGVGTLGLFLDNADLWLIGIRSALTLFGVFGALVGIAFAISWRTMQRARGDSTRDRSADPLPMPAELQPMLADLLRLGFVRVGQTETSDGISGKPRVSEMLAASFDSRLVASLSFSRNRASIASYLPDGRIVETGYPPLGLADLKVPQGWQILPPWLQYHECADGVEAALSLIQTCLAAEAARGCFALAIPGYLTAINWENAATGRIRVFHEKQLWITTRNRLWLVPLCLIAIWMGVFATWS